MMNLPWIIGAVIAILFFAYFEWRAFQYPERQNTLSRWIYNIGSNWPLSIWLMGMLAGGLAVHFFWHWCPANDLGVGFLSAPYQVESSVTTATSASTISQTICTERGCKTYWSDER